MRKKTHNVLLALGFDTDLISKIDRQKHTVTALRALSDAALRSYYTAPEIQLIKDHIKRKPIPDDVLERVISDADGACCFCGDGNSARPYQIHHIVEHAKTQDNSEDNLLLICPSHHSSVPKEFSADEQKARRRSWHAVVKIARAYRARGLEYPYGLFLAKDYRTEPRAEELINGYRVSPSTALAVSRHELASEGLDRLRSTNFLLVVGASGDGKTTLAAGIGGLLATDGLPVFSYQRPVTGGSLPLQEILTFLESADRTCLLLLDDANLFLSEAELGQMPRMGGTDEISANRYGRRLYPKPVDSRARQVHAGAYGRLVHQHGARLVIVDDPPVKKRAANASAENAGINYVRVITDREQHIFRRVHEEDVGVDAHVEFCRRPEEPSGFVVGIQVKAGESHVRNETESAFTFYPSIEDLQYWRSYALPIYLVVYHPARDVAYWLDIKMACDDKRFADIRAGISPCKLVFQKSDTFADTFFGQVIPADDLDQQRLYHTLLATAFEDAIDISTPMLPVRINHRIRQLDAPTAAKTLRFVDSKFPECVAKMMAGGQREESLVEEYVREVAHKLRERSFTAEGTGFVFMAFDDAGVRDKAAVGIEAIMPTNRYLVLKARRCMGPVLMDHMLLVALDDWDANEERFTTAWTPLKQSLEVALGGTYDLDFYGPNAAATFLTPDYAFQYEFETFLDTGHELELFDRCRLHARDPKQDTEDQHLWITVAPDRVKAYYMWEQGIYWYLHCIRAVRTGEPWLGMYDYVLRMEFEVEDEEEREEFIRKAKAATCLAELPFMTKDIKDTIDRGMEWGRGNSVAQ